MEIIKKVFLYIIFSFPFLKFNQLYSQGWNACMDAPENCGSGGPGKTIGDQVEWWQSILIVIVVSLIIYYIFKKSDSDPIKVTAGIIGGIIIFSAISTTSIDIGVSFAGLLGYAGWCLFVFLADKFSESSPVKKPSETTKVVQTGSMPRKKSHIKNEGKTRNGEYNEPEPPSLPKRNLDMSKEKLKKKVEYHGDGKYYIDGELFEEVKK